MSNIENLHWLYKQLNAEAEEQGIGQGSEGARYCLAAADEIESLRQQLASANVLIAEQNKLAKERQEWALHTNEVIRSLNQQLAEALAACKMKDEALRWIAGQPASGAIQCRATEAIAIHSDDEALEQLASTALEQAAKICEGQTEGFGSTSVWDSSALSCAEAIRAIKELP